jgi:hypothetical protein
MTAVYVGLTGEAALSTHDLYTVLRVALLPADDQWQRGVCHPAALWNRVSRASRLGERGEARLGPG